MSDLEVTSPTTDRGTYIPYRRRPLVMRGEKRVWEGRIGVERGEEERRERGEDDWREEGREVQRKKFFSCQLNTALS